MKVFLAQVIADLDHTCEGMKYEQYVNVKDILPLSQLYCKGWWVGLLSSLSELYARDDLISRGFDVNSYFSPLRGISRYFIRMSDNSWSRNPTHSMEDRAIKNALASRRKVLSCSLN